MYKKAAFIFLGALALLMVSNYFTRVILPALNPSVSDFSELYATSWLWRQGQNPYDPELASAASNRVVGRSESIYLVNAPTALVLVAPFTLLRWMWANWLFLTLGMVGLATTIFVILRLQRDASWGLERAALIVFLLSFSPLRIAFQWGNIVLLVLPLLVLAIWLAESKCNWPAGVLLGVTVCLKPQIGIWPGIYYLLRGRIKIVSSCLAITAFVAALFFLHPIPSATLIASYRSNLEHWFAPGGLYGFTEGSVPFLLLRTQGNFYRLTHSVLASNWAAQILFAGGAAAWGILVWRSGDQIPSSLAIAALLSLSFLSLYHSLPDASVLTLALCDAFPVSLPDWTRPQKIICVALFVMMLPGRLIFELLNYHLSASITRSWWWDFFLVRYAVWLLLALSFTLLVRMREVQRRRSQSTVTTPC
jgi:hypothetical protein